MKKHISVIKKIDKKTTIITEYDVEVIDQEECEHFWIKSNVEHRECVKCGLVQEIRFDPSRIGYYWENVRINKI